MARRKKFDPAALQARSQSAAEGLSARDRSREAEVKKEIALRSTRHLDRVKTRPGGDTRPLNAEHVVALAESIDALGLIEPLVLDRLGHLLAGGHRYAACALLDHRKEHRDKAIHAILEAASDKQRPELEVRIEALSREFDVSAIPVRVFDFDARQDQDQALAIETSENTQRRDYTPAEVLQLYKRLIEAGYTDRRGKPRKTDKQAKPAVALVIGKSVRTVQRMLKQRDASVNTTDVVFTRAVCSLDRAAKRFKREVDKANEVPDSVAALADCVEQMQELLEQALGELQAR